MQCQSNNQTLAFVFMDLDDFKEVNVNYGHHIRDKLLINLPQRMQEA
jgi:diguanylate cyclase (GGDEF)-like protein